MQIQSIARLLWLSWTAVLTDLPSHLPVPSRPAPVMHSVDELKSDARQLREDLENHHPALYEFTDQATFGRLYAAALDRLDKPMTSREFFQIVAPIVARVGCGHTNLIMPADSLKRYPDRYLPLSVVVLGDRMFVGRAVSAPGAGPVGLPELSADTTGRRPAAIRPVVIPAGSEIVDINGLDVTEILARLKTVISADAGNDTWKTARLNASTLHDLYALMFGFPETFELTFDLPDQGGRQQATVPALTRQAVAELPKARERKNSTSTGDPNLDFAILREESTAVLTIRSFSYYGSRGEFYAFIDSSFDRMQAAACRKLILDLRHNSGGDPFCTTHLLAYLASVPVPYFARVYPGVYEPLARPVPLAGKRFTGTLYVLIDGGCFSSTGHLCALLKYHRLGTFIGSETGATYECNDAAQSDTLQATGLRLRVARTTYTVAVANMPRGTGVMPDHPVQPTLADILAGHDTVMEYTRSLSAKATAP